MFLRDYLNAIFYQQKPDRRKRTCVYDTSNFATGETKAPLNAPRWTKSGYNGLMKAVIKRAVSNIIITVRIPPKNMKEIKKTILKEITIMIIKRTNEVLE